MPIYAYVCSKDACRWRQETLVDLKDKNLTKVCSRWGSESYRDGIQAFATKSVVHGSPMTDKEIDLVVGSDSEKKWAKIESDKQKRHARMVEKGATDRKLDVSGKPFNPHDHLGDNTRKALGRFYTEVAKEKVKQGPDIGLDGRPKP